jgi:hypothetical protein
MEKVMFQFRHRGSAPTPARLCKLFDLKLNEIDPVFGVIATDPVDDLYTVLIDARATGRVESALASRPADPAEGVFANPRIEPLGPPDD